MEGEAHTDSDEKKPGAFGGSTEKFRINKDHGPGTGHSWKSAVGARLLRARGALPSRLRCREGRGAGTQVETVPPDSHGTGTPALCPRLILFYETQMPGAMFLYGICELNIYFV